MKISKLKGGKLIANCQIGGDPACKIDDDSYYYD
jgi:hypothetical protein